MDAMTVGELIEFLKQFDSKLPVMSCDRQDSGGFIGVTSVVGGEPLIHIVKMKEVDSDGQIWYNDWVGPENKVIREFDAVSVEW